MKQFRYFLVLLVSGLTMMLSSCEKFISPENGETTQTGNLKVSIMQLEQTPFADLTRTAASEVCTRLNFAVYDMEGTRLKQINQKVDESDFGTTAFQLTEGKFQLVVLAHSSESNPTMTNPSKIQFSNSTGYSDTFLYQTNVTVGDEPQTLVLSLRRIVALCRFVINDAIPEGVASLEFQYTGGSGHFDAKTGLGVTKSTQKMSFDVQAGTKQTTYDLYTFLHETKGIIHLKVSAYDADDNKLHEREFDVAMEQNKITWLTGDFFTGVTPTTSQTLTPSVTVNSNWGGETRLTY